jgi:hypothetical protein
MKNKVPTLIYKYYPINDFTFDIIKNKYFWISDFKKLNDPLDCRFEYSDELIKKHFPNQDIMKVKELQYDTFGWGVCSFSTKKDSFLMWSHYTNNHTGICIEFDTSKDTKFERLNKINYSDDFPIIMDFEDIVTKGILRKTTNWDYEEEWRLIMAGGGDEKINFNIKSIKKIYLGYRISNDNIEKIKIIMKSHYRNKVELFKCKINHKLQSIDFESIK